MASPKARVLIVDDDEILRLLLTNTLTRCGFSVRSAADGAEGLVEIHKELPDVVILDVIMPRMDGWTFLLEFRSLRRSAFVPVIFLSSRISIDDKLRGFRMGADDYLPKPCRGEDVAGRIEAVLAKSKKLQLELQPKTPAAPAFHGKLSGMGLGPLLMMFDTGRKSGILELSDPERGVKGRVLLRDGAAVQATLEAKPPQVHREAVYEMLRWTAGRFSFKPMPVHEADEMRIRTDRLLVEGARRIDKDIQ